MININQVLFSMLDHKVVQQGVVKKIESQLYKSIVEDSDNDLLAVKMKKYDWSRALLRRALTNINKGYFSRHVLERLSNALLEGAFHRDKTSYRAFVNDYKEKFGVKPPSFLVISPTQRCNLKCTNCYACSDAQTTPHLSYDVFDKIVGDFRKNANGRFVVISGGEPTMYHDGDKTLLDIFEKYQDVFFMFYTNGTLIDQKMADRLEKTGNAVPAISVEGYEKETDERRGKGVFKRILRSFEILRNTGVPYIISVTTTTLNTELLLSDDFYKFYFDEQGVSFMWQFQLMPIGRGKSAFEMVPPPADRLKLYRKWEQMLKNNYPVADFWNSGVLVNGCVAYGRNGGYVYIDWNGDIMPCVFVPYTIDNVNKLYAEGKSLCTALKSPLMINGRNWQNKTQLDNRMHADNLLMPCSIRDHYENFRSHILTKESRGADSVANEILKDKEYYDNLVKYDKDLENITEDIWEKEYLEVKS
ncbi:MAG: radical SAM protein [Bacteroidaceae bacterium]|nr:radical SAM protein [Bacteroidaceae bacterium]